LNKKKEGKTYLITKVWLRTRRWESLGKHWSRCFKHCLEILTGFIRFSLESEWCIF